MNIKEYIIIGIFLIMIPKSTIAQNTIDDDGEIAGTKLINKPHKTLFFYLKPVNCPKRVSDYMSGKIRKKLNNIEYLELVDQKKIQEVSEASKKEPFINFIHRSINTGKNFSAHRIIIGSLKRKKIRYFKQLEETGEGQYLLKKYQAYRYSISLEIVDLKDNEQIMEYKNDFWYKDRNKIINYAADEIEKYFRPRKVRVRIIPELKFNLLVSGSYLLFMGQSSDISDIGGGLTAKPELENFYINNSVLQLSLGYYFLNEKKSRIKSYNLSQFSILGGYSFKFLDFISKRLRFIPLIGFGYHFHAVTSTDKGYELFTDPFISFQYDITYSINDSYGIIFSNGFSFIIETDEAGIYTQFSLGLKRFF